MALLFKNSIPNTAAIPSVLEFPDNYIFNGQMYDKYSFEPIPLKFFYDITSGQYAGGSYWNPLTNYPTFKKQFASHYYWTYPKQKNTMEMDITDPNTFYMITNFQAQNVCKVVKNSDGSFSLSKQSNLNYNGYDYNDYRLDIVDQDNNYLYVIKNTSATSNNGIYVPHPILYKINKSDMTFIKVDMPNYYYKAKVIYKDSINIYIFFTSSENTSYPPHIYRIKKQDMTITDLTTYSKDSILQALPTDIAYIDTGANTATLFIMNVVSNVIGMKKITLDTFNCIVVSVQDMACYETLSGVDQNILVANAYDQYDYVECMYHEANGNKYITIFRCCASTYSSYPNKTTTLFLVFKIMPDGRCKLVQRQTFPLSMQGFLGFDNNTNFVLLFRGGIKSYYWDVDSENFKLVNEIVNPTLQISVDENDNLWTYCDDGSINVYSKYIPMTMLAEFELDKYDWQGTIIDSHLTYYTRNFNGQYIQCTVKITLDGPCNFVENGKKEITKVTSPTGPLTLPIEVIDEGAMRVGIELIQA